MKIEIEKNDLEWIAQTVHNAYHNPPEGNGGHWRECKKSVCDFIQQTIYTIGNPTVRR